MRVLADGRVRRSESEWRSILERYEASGESETGFCRRSKIPRSSFVKWKRRLRSAAPSAPVVPRFVEWAPPRVPTEPTSNAGEFELVLPGGVVLRWRA